MKSKITVIFAMLLLFALTGCNNTPQTEKMPEPFSFSESSEQTSEQDTLPANTEKQEVETTPEPTQSTEPAETQSTAEVRDTESSKPKEPEQTAVQTSAPQDEPPQKTESETPTVTPETEAPPVQTETTESAPPQKTPPQPKSIYDYEFDIDAICAELIAVGEGMGLTHSGDLTPENASWATPVTASADFQGENLKRRLKDYVQSMPELITAYGGNPIQYFTIYAEPLGGGSYRIYFLY